MNTPYLGKPVQNTDASNEVTDVSALTLPSLQIRWSFGNIHLTDLKMEKKLNDHIRVTIAGTMSKQDAEKLLVCTDDNEQVEIQVKTHDPEAQPDTLFWGRVHAVELQVVHEVYSLTIKLLSNTYVLDTTQEMKSFQQEDLLYDDLICEIIEPHDGYMIDLAFNNKEIGKCVVQYNETTWEFCKRLASHVGAKIVPEAKAGKPRFWIGISEYQKVRTMKTLALKKRRDLVTYRQIKDNQAPDDWNEWLVTGYEFKTYQLFELCDSVEVGSETFVISEAMSQMEGNLLVHKYKCLPQKGIWQTRIPHKKIIGAAIQGTVIGTKEKHLKVHLAFDGEQDPEKATWFPYSIGNKVLKALPPEGAPVKLYFPSANEEEALVIGSVRTD